MVQLTRRGYSRKLAPALIELATKAGPMKDKKIVGISLRQNLLATLEIDRDRVSPDTKMIAQNERELLMKQQLLAHLQHESQPGSKVLVRFGHNHLHRGFDTRGISTLGNFVVEFATRTGSRRSTLARLPRVAKKHSWARPEMRTNARTNQHLPCSRRTQSIPQRSSICGHFALCSTAYHRKSELRLRSTSSTGPIRTTL